MKLATWNVNSIKARHERLLAFLARESPDVVCLQETKVLDEAFPHLELRAAGYYAVHLGQRAYNGVAILSKEEPRDVFTGMKDDGEEEHARLIGARFGDVHVISAYFPNGGDMGSDKYAYKLSWLKRLREELDRRFTADDSVALCGDYNVAPYPDDVSLKDFEGSVLANPEIRSALEHVAAFGLTDVVRPFHPKGGVYTWWDYRAMGFERNHGLRIDHVYATPSVAGRVIGAVVDRNERKGKGASDHAPLLVELE
ncbi:MAG: exodeoxyribonuclease III [Sandaracinus sp.]|nr:exodeoxyribonuclease III [Sandaracinus sp.]MCB9619025.1 exodeoxyribonuclease III [Sandaracinus sp.]